MTCKYILVTPAKNEEKNIENLIKSVDSQDLKPSLWVIVDDNSDDRTPFLLKKYSEGKDYIRIVKFPVKKGWDIGIHYSEVCIFGFESAIRIAKKEHIDYEYIGLLDADIILENNYFIKLIKKMESDKKIGIIGGAVYSWNGNKYILEHNREDLPTGAARLWRKEAFEKTNGYMQTYSPDTVSNIKVKIHGWKTYTLKEAKAYQTRLTSSAMGSWKGLMKVGMSVYYLFYPPEAVLGRVIRLSLTRGVSGAIAFLLGYFKAWVNRYPRIDDEEIKEYFRNKHKDMINYYLKRAV